MTPQKENQQGQRLYHSPGPPQPPAPGPPGRRIEWLRGTQDRGVRDGEGKGTMEWPLVSSMCRVHLTGTPWGQCGLGHGARVQSQKEDQERAGASPTLLPISPSPLCRRPFLTGHPCGQAPSGHTSLRKVKPGLGEAGWGQSLEQGRGPLTEGGRPPFKPRASARSLPRLRNPPAEPDTVFLLRVEKAGAVCYLSTCWNSPPRKARLDADHL